MKYKEIIFTDEELQITLEFFIAKYTIGAFWDHIKSRILKDPEQAEDAVEEVRQNPEFKLHGKITALRRGYYPKQEIWLRDCKYDALATWIRDRGWSMKQLKKRIADPMAHLTEDELQAVRILMKYPDLKW